MTVEKDKQIEELEDNFVEGLKLLRNEAKTSIETLRTEELDSQKQELVSFGARLTKMNAVWEDKFLQFQQGLNTLSDLQSQIRDAYSKRWALITTQISDNTKSALEKIQQYYHTLSNKQRDMICAIIDGKLDDYSIKTKNVFTSKVKIRDNQTVNGDLDIVNQKGFGVIDQILIKCNLSTYGLWILVDGNIIFDKNYTYFAGNSDYLQNVSAFLDGGYYYVSIRNLSFQEKFHIKVNSTAEVIFDEILVKYTIRDEIPV